MYPLQFGFQENNSIDHALTSMTEEIRSSLDSRRYGCGILLDLQKAFDTVNHDILLAKLEHYGVRGNVLNWFKSYLSERSQFVSINGSNSILMRTTCGVTQGSVLRPMLFLFMSMIYQMFQKNLKKFKFHLFADDTNIYSDCDTLACYILGYYQGVNGLQHPASYSTACPLAPRMRACILIYSNISHLLPSNINIMHITCPCPYCP